MKYLYKNEDDFKVERKLGQTWYYCDVLKSAIEKYGLSENPDYDELDLRLFLLFPYIYIWFFLLLELINL